MIPPIVDTAVVGAGPVGCLTAMAIARQGREVTVFEADPFKRERFAGEWLHPSGIEVLLRSSALDPDELAQKGMPHRGFVIFPDDGTAPVLLDYPQASRGIVCEHSVLVDFLRRKALATPGVHFISSARVGAVEPGQLSYRKNDDLEMRQCRASRIVGADGRSSVVRAALGLPGGFRLVSYMAGFHLKDLVLPYEGYGHVILGAPGPILLYRVSPNLVRASIDVPTVLKSKAMNWPKLLAEEYAPVLPDSLRAAFLGAVATEPLAFRANGFRSRVDYGTEALSLVGDAVGFHHPLTAMGMTLGFQDADSLVRANSFSAFAKERRSTTLVPELLAMALYQAFSGCDDGSREIRAAIYRMWEHYPMERERTMRLLSGDVTSPMRFGTSFLRGIQLALARSVDMENHRMEWSRLADTAGSIGQILGGLASCSSDRVSRLPLAGLMLRS